MDSREERALGQIETSMALMHRLNGNTQTASVLSLSGHLDCAALAEAVELLYRKHPLLRCSIRQDGQQLRFQADVALAAIQLRCLELQGTQSWLAGVEAQLDEVLDPEVALWKLTLLREFDGSQQHLVLTCHHAIVDALSLVLLLQDLLHFCDQLMAGQPCRVDPAPLAEPLEHYLRTDAERLPENLPSIPPVAFFREVPVEQRRTRILQLELEEAELATLHAAAKRRGFSLNSVLAAALIQAAREVDFGERIKINTAVSLRQRGAELIGTDVLGCFIAVVGAQLQAAGRSLEELAADYQAQLRPKLAHCGQRAPAVAYPALAERSERLRQSRAFEQGVALTNHGVIDFPQAYRFFAPRAYRNVASRVAGNFAVALHVAGFRNRLWVGFTFPAPIMDEGRIALLKRRFQQALLSFSATTEVA